MSGISRETEPIGYKEIYFKELAHVFMEAENSRDLQLASWRDSGELMECFGLSRKT